MLFSFHRRLLDFCLFVFVLFCFGVVIIFAFFKCCWVFVGVIHYRQAVIDSYCRVSSDLFYKETIMNVCIKVFRIIRSIIISNVNDI